MTVENFILDSANQSVSWIYGEKVIKETFRNVHFASVNEQEHFVYVESGHNYSQDQVYYISFDGKPIFTLDKIKGKVSWLHQDQLVEVNCKNIISAKLYVEQAVIIVITASNQVDGKLEVFALDGILLFAKQPPQGYSFVYLSTSKNKPFVVCDGEKTNADAYGRSRWHFAIDTKTGDMIKENLAY